MTADEPARIEPDWARIPDMAAHRHTPDENDGAALDNWFFGDDE